MILLGDSEKVAKWVLDRIPGPQTSNAQGSPYEAIGFLKGRERLCGGVVYYNYRGHDIEAMAAGEPGWLTPLNVKAIFLYPFVELKCRRMTVFVARGNKRSRRFVERLGFKLEGVKRKAMPDGQDEFVFGLLASECRWIEL